MNAGALTIGSGTTGVAGPMTTANSAIGLAASTNLQSVVVDNTNNTFFGRFLSEGAGKVRVGSQISGFANAAPVLASIETSALPYAPSAAAVAITSTLTLADEDSGNTTGATVVISAGFLAGDVLGFVDTTNITGIFAAGTLTLTGSDTKAAYQAALRSVTFVSSTGNPAARTVSFQVNDGSGVNNLSNVPTRVVGGTAQLVGSTLNVYGTSLANTISLTQPGTLDVNVDSVVTSFTSAAVTAINVFGFDGNDTITVNNAITQAAAISGGNGNDTLTGGGGNDMLTGGANNDTLNGGAGDDSLTGGLGNDTYIFSTATSAEVDGITENSSQGTDTVSFADLTTSVSFSLASASVQAVHANRTLQLSSSVAIENLIGGSDNDILSGNLLPNVLTGNAGNDRLNGASGNDSLLGGLGDDSYLFATATSSEADVATESSDEGTDVVSFLGVTTSVSFTLGSSAVQSVHSNRTLQLSSATTFENAMGGSGADTLTGNSLANVLNGSAGHDTLNDGPGSDSLVGGPGDDSFVFGDATGSEADTVTEASGQGTDTLNFSSVTTAISLDLGTSVIQAVHTNRTLKLSSSVSFENVIGGLAGDTLTGNTANNMLTGGPGDDVLTGNPGNDTLNGGAGLDQLTGGPGDDNFVFGDASSSEADTVTEASGQGTDTLNFSSVTTAVSLDLGSSVVQTVHTNRTLKLSSSASFENIIGGLADNVLSGNSGNNSLTGGPGNDVLIGNSGNDTLSGAVGRDVLIGGLGLDMINGGSGDDILIAGRTTSDRNIAGLIAFRTEWISDVLYATRIANLRSGVGSPAVSLKATMNVLNDGGEHDVLTGGDETDWYIKAVDDIITDLFGAEITDVL